MFDLDQIAAIVCTAAKEELLPRFRHVERQYKRDRSVITEADTVMQQRLQQELQAHWPQTAFLGEEMTAPQQQSMLDSAQPVWCLDPLDGTSNFANGIPYFCVSLALIEQGEVSVGVVYDPLRDECFRASRERGAWLNTAALKLQPCDLLLPQTTAIVDFKRLKPSLASHIVQTPPYASQRSFGSVALDWCWLAAGRGQLYLHGKQNLWDYAAGHFIFEQAGGFAETLEGETVFRKTLTPRAALAAVDAELFARWRDWVRQHNRG